MNEVENFLASHPFAETTKNYYRRILQPLTDLPALETLSAAELIKFISRPKWGNSHQYVFLSACRKYLAWTYGPQHPALSARIKRLRTKKQRVLSIDIALELLASFDTSTAKGARDLAIAALALDTGLRASELSRLRLEDVDLKLRTLTVIVKGGQWGMAIYSPEAAQYISEWLAFRRGSAVTLFTSTRTWLPLSVEGLKTTVKKWGAALSIKLSPHDLRRSMATLSTIFGAPSRVVQLAGRWSNIEMVEYYTRTIDQSAFEPYFPTSQLVRIQKEEPSTRC